MSKTSTKLFSLLTAGALTVSLMAVPAFALDEAGQAGWSVTFTSNNQMEDNFSAQGIADQIADLQPGDTVTFHVSLTNSSDSLTDWYMTNEVVKTLEDAQAVADNGGYSYKLTYNSSKENIVPSVIYDSEAIGGDKEAGEGQEGLLEATDSLDEYFFLEQLTPGASASVDLAVTLDGESQGNVYQDTWAKLQMNFAVEKTTTVITTPSVTPSVTPNPSATPTPTPTTRIITVTVTPTPSPSSPKTGDNNNTIMWIVLAAAAGGVLLTLGIISMKRRKEDE